MKRRPSAQAFLALCVLFLALFVAAGFISGKAGLGMGAAMLIMIGIGLVAIPSLILVAPKFPQNRARE